MKTKNWISGGVWMVVLMAVVVYIIVRRDAHNRIQAAPSFTNLVSFDMPAMFEWLVESNRQFFLSPDLRMQETQRFTPYAVLQREDGEIAVADGNGKRMDLVTGSNRLESAISFANYISNRDKGTLPPAKPWKEIGKP